MTERGAGPITPPPYPMLKIQAHLRLKMTAGADSGFPSPSMQGRTSGHEDESMSHELFAAEDVIAPSMDFKEKNEKAVEKQQDDVAKSEGEKNKSPATAALARLKGE